MWRIDSLIKLCLWDIKILARLPVALRDRKLERAVSNENYGGAVEYNCLVDQAFSSRRRSTLARSIKWINCNFQTRKLSSMAKSIFLSVFCLNNQQSLWRHKQFTIPFLPQTSELLCTAKEYIIFLVVHYTKFRVPSFFCNHTHSP